jgi:hypothetical protein
MTSTEVTDLLAALRDGTMTLEEVAERFRRRSWPPRDNPRPANYVELAARAQEDPDGGGPGSFDEVTAALYRGEISDEAYQVLAQAMAESKRDQDHHEPRGG